MRIVSVPVFVLVVAALFVCPFTSAQEKAKPADPAPAPTLQLQSGKKLVPEVGFNAIGFSDVIDFLRDVDPSFQAVVSYGPGAEPGSPVIQELKLKNVSVATVLEVIRQAYPQVHIDEAQADGDRVIYMIRVEDTGGGDDDGKSDQRVTAVHRLREIVDDLCRDTGGTPKDRDAARKSVMSLVQVALETQDSTKAPSSVKLHESTETLVFRGTARQGNLVETALFELQPVKKVGDDMGQSEKAKLLATVHELQQEVARLKSMMKEQELKKTPEPKPNAPSPASPEPSNPNPTK